MKRLRRLWDAEAAADTCDESCAKGCAICSASCLGCSFCQADAQEASQPPQAVSQLCSAGQPLVSEDASKQWLRWEEQTSGKQMISPLGQQLEIEASCEVMCYEIWASATADFSSFVPFNVDSTSKSWSLSVADSTLQYFKVRAIVAASKRVQSMRSSWSQTVVRNSVTASAPSSWHPGDSTQARTEWKTLWKALATSSSNGPDGVKALLQFQVPPGPLEIARFATVNGSMALRAALGDTFQIPVQRFRILEVFAAGDSGAVQVEYGILCANAEERKLAAQQVEASGGPETVLRFSAALLAALPGLPSVEGIRGTMLDRSWSSNPVVQHVDGGLVVESETATSDPTAKIKTVFMVLAVTALILGVVLLCFLHFKSQELKSQEHPPERGLAPKLASHVSPSSPLVVVDPPKQGRRVSSPLIQFQRVSSSVVEDELGGSRMGRQMSTTMSNPRQSRMIRLLSVN